MGLLAGAFVTAAVLLTVGGLAKLRDPLPLVRAMRAMRLPLSPFVVRSFAAAETTIGGAAVVNGSRLLAAAVAASYLAFSVFVLVALLRGGALSSCGCFGRVDTPATRLHVAVTAGLAAVAVAVAVRPTASARELLAGHPGDGAALLATSAALTAVVYLAIAVHPRLVAVRLTSRP